MTVPYYKDTFESFFDITGKYNDSEYRNYVQQRKFHEDHQKNINSLFDDASTKINRNNQYLSEIADSQKRSDEIMQNGFESVVGSVSHLQGSIKNMETNLVSSINNVHSLMNLGFQILIEQNRINRELLEQLVFLMSFPDSEKQRQLEIQRGMDFYFKAIHFGDENFYEDALTFLSNAEKHCPQDYFVLHKIGMIYANSPKLASLPMAQEYFVKAARYAEVDTHPNAQGLVNILTKNLNPGISNVLSDSQKVLLLSAESYYLAGKSFYEQGMFQDAVNYLKKAWDITPQRSMNIFLDCGFILVKSLIELNGIDTALPILKEVIERDKNFYTTIKIGIDEKPSNQTKKIIAQPKIRELLITMRDELNSKVSTEIKEIKSMINPSSQFWSLIEKIDALGSENSYIAGRKAIEFLNKEHVI